MKPGSKRVLNPKLRFPEFRDAPGWTHTKLADVLTEHGTKNDGNCKVHSVSVHKGIVNQIEHLGRSYAAADTSNYNLVKPHDIVYTKSPTGDFPFGIVKQSRHPYDVIVSPLYGVFSPTNKHLGSILDAYFESPVRTKNYLAPITQKGAKNTIQISNQTFLSGKIYVPSDIREHEQIGECLTSLDELIAAHAQKLDALETHEKGLMQKLFPLEGETIPRFRFPEFQAATDWAARELGDFITERNQYPKEAMTLFSLTIENGVTPKTERYERSFLVNDEVDAYKMVLPGDFVLNPMNLRFGAIGRHRGANSVVVSKYYNIFSCDNTVDPRFCEIYFKSEQMVAYYDKMAIGSLLEKRRVHFGAFLKFQIRFPQLAEQQKIAACLSSLGELIGSERQKLE